MTTPQPPTPRQGSETQLQRPEWLRPNAVPHFFGIGRTKVYELLAEGKIKSVSLRERGQKHGTRLISYDSVAEYLNSLAE